MAPTLKSVAKLLGVSPATISRVLNNNTKHTVSEAKRKYILEGIKKYGYHPNPAARSLVMQQTLDIGLIMHVGTNIESVINPNMSMETMMSAQSVLQKYGYGIRLAFISREKPELSFAKLFEKRKPFEAVVFPPGVATDGIIDFVLDYKLPCAAIYGAKETWPVNQFGTDIVTDIKKAVEHLIGIGRRKIGFIGWSPYGRAERGFPDVLRHYGLDVNEQHIVCIDLEKDKFLSHRDHGRRVMKKFIASNDLPDAIVCVSDFIAFGVIDVMEEEGLRVGKDIALIGREDIESFGFLPYGEPILTTFRWPHKEIGETVGQVLIDQIKDKDIPLQKKLYPGKFVLRRSASAEGK